MGSPLRIDQRTKLLASFKAAQRVSNLAYSRYDIIVFGGPGTFLSGIPLSDILFRISAETADVVTG
jgi:hypothetical protein